MRKFVLFMGAFFLLLTMVLPVGQQEARAEDTESRSVGWTIGYSVEGRPLEVFCFGSGPEIVLMIGGLHTGTEANSASLARVMVDYFRENSQEIPKGTALCVLPAANPDGLSSGSHNNARNVDLNRNWPSANWQSVAYHPTSGKVSGGERPLSEPETRAIWRLISRYLKPSVVGVWHCCGSLVEANEVAGAEDFARTYVRVSSYSYLDEWTAYPITGQFIDAASRIDVAAFDIELTSPGEIDFIRNLRGVKALLESLVQKETHQYDCGFEQAAP